MRRTTMNFDVQSHLTAAERSVAALERDGQPARAVTLSRRYATTLDDLWDAVTSSERIPRWFLPISGELEQGGHYSLEGNADGRIVACERRSHFALTWEFDGDVSWVHVQLSGESPDGATLALTHTALLSPHWDEYGPGAAGVGWELGLLGLALHIAQPSAPKPDEVAFVASRDGKAFIVGSSNGWANAAIAAGAPPAAAQAAANRTTAFYIGE